MKIILVTLVTCSFVAVWVTHVVILQKRNDNRFVDWLRGQPDTILLKNVHFAHERIGVNHYTAHRKSGDLLVGSGFVVFPSVTPAALYSKAKGRKGVRGITWSAAIDRVDVLGEDALQIDCRLPDDLKGFSRITFEGILSDSSRDEILRRLGPVLAR
jgi:hypothetical protein